MLQVGIVELSDYVLTQTARQTPTAQRVRM